MPDPIGIIEQFLHPPLAVMTEAFDPRGPYGFGSHTLTTVGNGVDSVATSFGVLVTHHTVPEEWGRDVGYLDVSEGLSLYRWQPWYAQVGVLHQLLATGANIWTQVDECQFPIHLVLWETARPNLIGLYVQPGWEVDLYWLRGT